MQIESRETCWTKIQPAQIALAGMLLLEFFVFSLIGRNFRTWDNFFEILRLSVELGLLALAMTPVIVTAGIDLSVGSLLGLSAILMGTMWKEMGLPLWIAAPVAVVFGALGGVLNAVLITRLRIPPLIVTLGSMSLFRGLAEGITGGARNYTDFPSAFLFVGQGHIGPIPTQVPLFVLAAIGTWILLHRSIIGRALSAIGYSPEGARYAGIPVERRIGLTYVLCGIAAGIAGVLYAAHWGQVKADAGTGYELEAITAVVLGGTSIFGGRGSVTGTLMGLFAIALLKNGLRLTELPPSFIDSVSDFIHHLPKWLGGFLLADGESIGSSLPAELANILTGLLLLTAIALDFKPSARKAAVAPAGAGGFSVSNAQVAVLSVVILIGAILIVCVNFWFARA